MARKGYNSITLDDGLVGRIDDRIDPDDKTLNSRPKVIEAGISELEKKKGGAAK